MREEGVLLLNTVPSLFTFNFRIFPDLISEVSEVSVCRHEFFEGLIIPAEGLAHDNDIITTADGVTEHSDRFEYNFRIVGDSLVG